MEWNLTYVEKQANPDILTIKGYDESSFGTCIISTITKTNLKDALAIMDTFDEGYALSIINPDEVYIIDISIYIDKELYQIMCKQPSVHSNDDKYFNFDYYMELPFLVFCQWKGMISTT